MTPLKLFSDLHRCVMTHTKVFSKFLKNVFVKMFPSREHFKDAAKISPRYSEPP